MMPVMSRFGGVRALFPVWAATRALLLLSVAKVLVLPGPDVTGDVSVIYRGWSILLRSGAFPADDVAWQYPPGAALAVLSPGLLPFLDYAVAFSVLLCAADATVLALLVRAGRGPGRGSAGAWLWVAGVPLLGPTGYARYDLMVTAVAVAALLAAGRRPRLAGALMGFGALLKVWPALLVTGSPRGARTRATVAAAATALGAGLLVSWAVAPGSLNFLTAQRGRGTEVESLGALVFHVGRRLGWDGQVLLHYGSVEFLGPYVAAVSRAALILTGPVFGWLLLWRWRARRWTAGTVYDAALTAVLLFTVTSRVISPQYLLWLVGLAAVCLTVRSSRQRPAALLVLAATAVTLLEFPVWFDHVVASDWPGIGVLALRNGLLVAAAVVSGARLWRSTVPRPGERGTPQPEEAAPTGPVRSG